MAQRIAVVTGATGTLGREIVTLLCAQGLAVVAVSRSGPPLGDPAVVSVAADMASDECITTIRQALPPGEVAFAVHAVGLPAAPGVLDVDPSMLGSAVNIKAGGLLRLVRAVGERLVIGSRVVAVGGHLGFEPSEHAPLAGVGNAALANLVGQLKSPLDRLGVTIRLAAPSYFDSPRTDRMVAARALASGRSESEVRAELAPSGIPTAAEVAEEILS